jgi:hypothetical protein
MLGGGLYAGVTGVTRGVCLVAGLVAVAIAAVVITMYAWTASHRSRR